jgi:leucyl-tRNA---protein transferase
MDHQPGESCPYPAWHPPADIRLTVLPEHRCSYLPDRVARSRAFWAEQLSPHLYHQLMNAGFRRSGKVVYQPICSGCRACLPIRIPLDGFIPNKSQRRCFRHNQDLAVTFGPLESSDEKWELYRKYIARWHGGQADDRAGFEAFLYESPIETIEFSYRSPDGELVAIGICDIHVESLSSVYFYFDPAESNRGLGTFGALYELDFAKINAIPYYYLGYWVDGCSAMSYKVMYRTHEILHPDNIWRPGVK